MKKRTLIIVAALAVLTIVAAFALSACSFKPEDIKISGDGQVKTEATNKEDSLTALGWFFEDTLKDTNMVVSVKSGNDVIMVETIAGTSSLLDFKTSKTQTYAFVNDGVYYSAVHADATEDTPETKYYQTGKEAYDANRYYFRNSDVFLGSLDDIEEKEGTTFTCVYETKDKDSGTLADIKTETTGTVNFEVKSAEGTATVTGTSKNGKVETVTLTIVNGEERNVMTFTFTYGSASVTVPDLADYSDIADDGEVETPAEEDAE